MKKPYKNDIKSLLGINKLTKSSFETKFIFDDNDDSIALDNKYIQKVITSSSSFIPQKKPLQPSLKINTENILTAKNVNISNSQSLKLCPSLLLNDRIYMKNDENSLNISNNLRSTIPNPKIKKDKIIINKYASNLTAKENFRNKMNTRFELFLEDYNDHTIKNDNMSLIEKQSNFNDNFDLLEKSYSWLDSARSQYTNNTIRNDMSSILHVVCMGGSKPNFDTIQNNYKNLPKKKELRALLIGSYHRLNDKGNVIKELENQVALLANSLKNLKSNEELIKARLNQNEEEIRNLTLDKTNNGLKLDKINLLKKERIRQQLNKTQDELIQKRIKIDLIMKKKMESIDYLKGFTKREIKEEILVTLNNDNESKSQMLSSQDLNAFDDLYENDNPDKTINSIKELENLSDSLENQFL